ncbi:MAG: hypothetical protein DCC65_04415 [Planctomycetota bacterium]|nr:MAG: hypothetical protein DCC65_04415 [Planctomycetota bacterium]
MPSDTLVEAGDGRSRAEHEASRVLACVAIVALAGNCLLNCPSRFSEKHLADTSLLRPVVDLLGLWGRFPTPRGLEIRNLVFYLGAAALAVIAGLRLALAYTRPRHSLDDLLDARARAASPYLWWLLLIAVSWLSSTFSHAPEVCQGQTIARMLHLSWWWPLAAMLAPSGARLLSAGLVAILTVTAGIGIWYHVARVLPDLPGARLQYPIGNELWFAACLLPAALVGAGLVVGGWKQPAPRVSEKAAQSPGWRSAARVAVMLLGVGILFAALALTRSRSAAAGLICGIFLVVALQTPRSRRLPVVLIMLLVGIGGALLLQSWRTTGSTGLRAHSIRARLDYEWPYAIRLFLEKPIAGNGDGAYALLAGQFGREDQLDDPNVMRFDERSWPAHAHNEFLELLSDVGLVGAAAFMLALLIPLYRAVQYCDRRRGDAAAAADRWLVIGLAGALAASIVEACGTPSIREPGAMPILLTVWACLWAMVRRDAPVPVPVADEKPLAAATIRLFGACVCVAALALGYRGAQDWRAMRARFEAGRMMDSGAYGEAARQADFASRAALDPFQQALARMISVWARSLEIDHAMAAQDGPPPADVIDRSAQALARLGRLKFVAPRFLRVARLEADIELNRARAYERRGEPANVAHCQERFVLALRQARADDPFLVERVEQIWVIDGAAGVQDRLLWLRCLLRGGEVDHRVVAMVRQLSGVPGFGDAVQAGVSLALQSEDAEPREWPDRLAPESCRIAALAAQLAGRTDDACALLATARSLYERAGPRLFAGHSAALHEEARYRFAAQPFDRTGEVLDLLARAYAVAYGPADRETVLHDVTLGRTRAAVLLAEGKEKSAGAQLKAILGANQPDESALLAVAYVDLARSFIAKKENAERVIDWLGRAQELYPLDPRALVLWAEAYLVTGDHRLALNVLERAFSLSRPVDWVELTRRLRARYPDSPAWAELVRRHPDAAIDAAATRPADG